MRRSVSNIISVLYTLIRFSILKLIHGQNFKFSLIERFSPNVIMELEKKGKIIIGKKVRAHSGTILKVRKNAELILNNNTSFNYNCMVFCRNKIVIGEGVEFGPGVKIYDHDHDYTTTGGIKAGKYKLSPVIIGDNCWIGCNSIILRGTKLGKNCVIGAGSVIKGEYPDNSIIVQKKNTHIINGDNSI